MSYENVGFARITKVDEQNRMVYGRAVQEYPDKSGEIFDYASSKPFFEKWSSEVQKDSGGKSLGNVRVMHRNVAAGKVAQLDFDDKALAIDIAAKIVDDDEWGKVLDGLYTGFSMGGRYIKKWTDETDPSKKRYTADPFEISLVDRPMIPTCTFFEVQKMDGTVAKVDFKIADPAADGDDTGGSAGATSSSTPSAGAPAAAPASSDAAGSQQPASKADDGKTQEYEVVGTAQDLANLQKLLNDNKLDLGAVIKVVSAHVDAQKAATAATEDPAAKEVKAATEALGLTEKGMACVNWLAECVTQVYRIRDCLVREKEIEGDDSSAPTMIEEAADTLARVLSSVLTEELRELKSGTGDKDKAYFETIFGPQVARMEKLDAEVFSKVAKMVAKGGMSHEKCYQKMHDMCSQMGAKCMKAAVDDGDLDSRVTKLLEGKLDAVTKPLLEKIEKLENTPLPAKAILKVVDKSKDLDNGAGNPNEIAPVMDSYGREVNKVATSIKGIHQQGGRPYLG